MLYRTLQFGSSRFQTPTAPKKGKGHPFTGTEALYRPYGP